MSKWDNDAPMTDMRAPEVVEVLLDRSNPTAWKLWINVDGKCRLRLYDIDPKTIACNYVEDSHGRD